jgi:DNA-binding winged helix-turn-helix (wHTH) protein
VVAKLLKPFLSTLYLLEQPNFYYKLFMTEELIKDLGSPSEITRWRLKPHLLLWNRYHLEELVQARLRLAMGQSDFTLAKLCSSPGLLDWLDREGKNSPRQWLNCLKPLVIHYLENNLSSPIDEQAWRTVCGINSYVDKQTQQIIVDEHTISLQELPEKQFEMLAYLYEQNPKIVSQAELYFQCYLGLDYIPKLHNKHYEFPKSYQGLIQTNIWRLRKAIEQIPDCPIVLKTHRGKGYSVVVTVAKTS